MGYNVHLISCNIDVDLYLLAEFRQVADILINVNAQIPMLV